MKYSLRNLLKFSIRDLLLLTVVVALAVGWSLDRSRLLEEVQNLNFRLRLAEARYRLEKSQAEANLAAADALAEYDRALKGGMGVPQAADEGPLRGYKLLGPPPSLSKP